MPADPFAPEVERGWPRAAMARPPIVDVVQPWVDDVDAFARVYDETSARVYGVVLRVVRDPAQAEEVAQEVYLECWRQADRYDPARGAAISWLTAIAHRRAVDRVRSSNASRRRDLTYGALNCRAGTVDETSQSVERLHNARVVRDAMSVLSVHQRRAIELAYFGGYTYPEVAALLDIPLGTAKSRIRTGLIQLRAALEGA